MAKPRTKGTKAKVAKAKTKPVAKKAAPKKKLASRRPERAPATVKSREPAFTTKDPRTAFDHFARLCDAMPNDVPVARFDVLVADANVKRAYKAILPELDRVTKLAPSIDRTAIDEITARSLAAVYAAGRVGDSSGVGATIADTVAHLAQLRQDTLAFLEIAGHRGLVPIDIAERIRAGHGNLDFAQDCVALAGAFHEHAHALAGKHPFTAKDFRDLAEGGAWLLDHLTPAGAPKEPATRSPSALLRDKLVSLVEDAYAELETAAVLAWGPSHFRSRIPTLRSRVSHARDAAAAADAAAPPPAGATSTKA